jgi:hypothetical protein
VDNIRSVFMLIGQLSDWIKSRINVFLKKKEWLMIDEWWIIKWWVIE